MTCLDMKPVRLLAAGAVTIVRRSDTRVDAHVLGDTATHRVVGYPTGWACDCPAWRYRGSCSHVDAVRLVTGGTP